tara:strand:+ start:3701 stop:4195 length:495 start_codon:yes stop_codon:yes gene_type:complete
MIYLSLGSNLNSKYGGRIESIKKTINLLKENNFKIVKVSKLYETPSYPNKNYPKFINIIIMVKYKNNLNTLFKKIKEIEKKMGRLSKKKNFPRTCDIDVIDFNGVILNSAKIVLPHPKAHKRNFVLYPLKDVNSNWKHPVKNLKINKLIKKLSEKMRNEIKRVK